MQRRSASRGGSIWLALPALALILTSILVVVGPEALSALTGVHYHPSHPTLDCKRNLKNLATSLEMYSSENRSYPTSLTSLTPNYLKAVPTCPGAGRKDTYSASFVSSGEHFTVFCSGRNHPDYRILGLEANYPQYTSRVGVSEGSEAHLSAIRSAEHRANLTRWGLGGALFLAGGVLVWLLFRRS